MLQCFALSYPHMILFWREHRKRKTWRLGDSTELLTFPALSRSRESLRKHQNLHSESQKRQSDDGILTEDPTWRRTCSFSSAWETLNTFFLSALGCWDAQKVTVLLITSTVLTDSQNAMKGTGLPYFTRLCPFLALTSQTFKLFSRVIQSCVCVCVFVCHSHLVDVTVLRF